MLPGCLGRLTERHTAADASTWKGDGGDGGGGDLFTLLSGKFDALRPDLLQSLLLPPPSLDQLDLQRREADQIAVEE